MEMTIHFIDSSVIKLEFDNKFEMCNFLCRIRTQDVAEYSASLYIFTDKIMYIEINEDSDE
jgi:hypothetical protein